MPLPSDLLSQIPGTHPPCSSLSSQRLPPIQGPWEDNCPFQPLLARSYLFPIALEPVCTSLSAGIPPAFNPPAPSGLIASSLLLRFGRATYSPAPTTATSVLSSGMPPKPNSWDVSPNLSLPCLNKGQQSFPVAQIKTSSSC